MISKTKTANLHNPMSLFFAAFTFLALMGLALAPHVQAGSTMRVKAASAQGKYITLGLNKSVIIETPQNVSDVLVSNPKIADAVVRNARRVYIIGMALGQANVVLFDKNGNQIAAFEINVTRDNASLAALFRRLIPGSNITVEGVGEGVALTGSVKSPSDSQKAFDLAANYIGDKEKVTNYISVESGEQVQLRVTVAEVQRTTIKQLGIELGGTISGTDISLAGQTDNPFSAIGEAITSSALGLQVGDSSNYVYAQLQAMERNGLVRTLAEPNLTAISGEEANFLAGGEFPIPVGVDDDTVTVEFKTFGVALAFKPVVMSENRISLQVKTEVSEISTDSSVTVDGLSIPGLNVRRAETTLELPSGGTMALAGLLKDDIRKSIDGIPGLKDVPVLGALFRSQDYKRSQTELVIFVTPYIVKPIARSKAALPIKNMDAASDMNTIFLGQLIRRYDMSGGGRQGIKYHGRFGYSYE